MNFCTWYRTCFRPADDGADEDVGIYVRRRRPRRRAHDVVGSPTERVSWVCRDINKDEACGEELGTTCVAHCLAPETEMAHEEGVTNIHPRQTDWWWRESVSLTATQDSHASTRSHTSCSCSSVVVPVFGGTASLADVLVSEAKSEVAMRVLDRVHKGVERFTEAEAVIASHWLFKERDIIAALLAGDQWLTVFEMMVRNVGIGSARAGLRQVYLYTIGTADELYDTELAKVPVSTIRLPDGKVRVVDSVVAQTSVPGTVVCKKVAKHSKRVNLVQGHASSASVSVTKGRHSVVYKSLTLMLALCTVTSHALVAHDCRVTHLVGKLEPERRCSLEGEGVTWLKTQCGLWEPRPQVLLNGGTICRKLVRRYKTKRSWLLSDSILHSDEEYRQPTATECSGTGTWDVGEIAYGWLQELESEVVTYYVGPAAVYSNGEGVIVPGYATDGCLITTGLCATAAGVVKWHPPSDTCAYQSLGAGWCRKRGKRLLMESTHYAMTLTGETKSYCGMSLEMTTEGYLVRWVVDDTPTASPSNDAVLVEGYELETLNEDVSNFIMHIEFDLCRLSRSMRYHVTTTDDEVWLPTLKQWVRLDSSGNGTLVSVCSPMECVTTSSSGCLNYVNARCGAVEGYVTGTGRFIKNKPTHCVVGQVTRNIHVLNYPADVEELGMFGPHTWGLHLNRSTSILGGLDEPVPIDVATKDQLGVGYMVQQGFIKVGGAVETMWSMWELVSEHVALIFWLVVVLIVLVMCYKVKLLLRSSSKHGTAINSIMTPLEVIKDGSLHCVTPTLRPLLDANTSL